MWNKPTAGKRPLAMKPVPVEKQPDTSPSSQEPNRAAMEEVVRGLRTQMQRIRTAADDQSGAAACNEFQRSVQVLMQCAATGWPKPILRVATAMDAVLNEVPPQPSQFNGSRLPLAVDVLETLIEHPELTPKAACDSAAVVMDGARGSSACNALRTAGFHPSSFPDTRAALSHLAGNSLDVVVVEMTADPDRGLEFYKKLRQLPLHRETPVIFVSETSGMKCPPQAPSDCETQFLTKPNIPFGYAELALKALSCVLNFRMGHAPSAPPPPPPVPPPPVPAASIMNPVQKTPQNQNTKPLKEESATESGLSWMERHTQSAHEAEVADLEKRVRESAAGCARATAELEKERADRRRLEQRVASLSSQLPELHRQLKEHLDAEGQHHQRIAELEKQLQEREEALMRASADLEKEKEEHQLAEEQLRETGEISEKLQESLTAFEATKVSFQRTQEQLEAQVQASARDLGESEARFQKEAAERQRAEEALAAAKRAQQEQATALSKLQSALQVEQAERQRLESGATHARYTSLDSARSGVTAGNRLRRQVREPLETLLKSTRRMLENAADDQSKQLVGSILENALLIQTSLQEKDSPVGTAVSNPPPKAA